MVWECGIDNNLENYLFDNELISLLLNSLFKSKEIPDYTHTSNNTFYIIFSSPSTSSFSSFSYSITFSFASSPLPSTFYSWFSSDFVIDSSGLSFSISIPDEVGTFYLIALNSTTGFSISKMKVFPLRL